MMEKSIVCTYYVVLSNTRLRYPFSATDTDDGGSTGDLGRRSAHWSGNGTVAHNGESVMAGWLADWLVGWLVPRSR